MPRILPLATAAALAACPTASAGGAVVGWGTPLDGQLPVPTTLGACNAIEAGSFQTLVGHRAAHGADLVVTPGPA